MKILLPIIFILFCSQAYGANLYLDVAATGCDNDGTPNINYDPTTRTCGPGSDTVYGGVGSGGGFPSQIAAAANASDTIYIREGSYYDDSNPSGEWNLGTIFLDTGQDNITITNYNGEEVWLQTGNDHIDIGNDDVNNPIAIWSNGVQIVGTGTQKFHIWGCAISGSGTGVVWDGIDFQGGWDKQGPWGGDAWGDVIRFYHSVNHIVRNSWIHDNYTGISSTTASANKSLIMHEEDINTTFQNNKFYNAWTDFVYAKYQSATGTIHATYKLNWFDGAGGFSGPNQYNAKDLLVFQNVFTGNTSNLFYKDGMASQHFVIYNNTFYNCSAPLYSWSSGDLSGHAWFNNIIYHTGSAYGVDFNEVLGTITGEYLDYNDYYGTLSFRHNSSSFANLSLWSAHVGTGDGTEDSSITSDPGFLPDDSTVDGNSPTDFKRSSYTANGRGGSYPSVMGAYVNGGEVIGVPSVSAGTGSSTGGGSGSISGGGAGSMSSQ